MKSHTALAIIAACLAAPAAGAESAWEEVAPGVSIRLVSSDVITDDDTLWMGLEIDMPADTKTYWRVPGESGVPLSIDTRGSNGISDLSVSWPFPKRETHNGYLDHAYYGRVLIPLKASVSAQDITVQADITLGICSEICVPARAGFTLTPQPASPDTSHEFRIRQALANVPLPHDGEGLVGDARFDEHRNAIVVERVDTDFPIDTMIAEIVGTGLVFDVPQLARSGREIVFPLLGRPQHDKLDDGVVRVSFDGPDGSFEIERTLVN